MQRSWILGLTVAGVAGTGTASYAAMGTGTTAATAPAVTDTATSGPVLAGDSIRTITYQVGPAGTATLATDGATIVVAGVSAGDGWTVVSATDPGAHVEVQYTDGTQLVTFIADLVNGDMAISITNTGVDSIVVTPIEDSADGSVLGTDPSDTLPATPPTVTDPVSSTPPPPVTTAPSGGHDDDDEYDDDEDEDEADDGDHDEDEHEDESDDHEEEEDD